MFPWFFGNISEVAPPNNLAITGIQKSFTYQSESPLIIGEMKTGTVIDTVGLILINQFNINDWCIQIKTETTNILLLEAIDPERLNLKEYESNPAVKIAQIENIIALINPGSSTTGEGIIKIDFPQGGITPALPSQQEGGNYLKRSFSFLDTFLIIGELSGNNIIDTVSVFFINNFNSNDWQISVETATSNITLLNISEPTVLNNKEYESNPSLNVFAGEQIICTISAGTATQGTGIIKVNCTSLA